MLKKYKRLSCWLLFTVLLFLFRGPIYRTIIHYTPVGERSIISIQENALLAEIEDNER